jgi:hypothetical protein
LLDIESGTDVTDTRITAVLAKKFLRDEVELKTTAVWEIESGAAMIMPSLIWTKNDAAVELSGGVFAGGNDAKGNEGLFGQFHDNSFIRAGLKYTF